MLSKIYTLVIGLHRRYRLMRLRRQLGNKDQFIYRHRRGYQMELHLDDHIAQRLLLSSAFEPQISAVMSSLVNSGMTVVDIGANIGVHTLDLARLVGEKGHVIAIEPNPAVFEQLKRNVALNESRNVIALEIALSNEDSSETFYFPKRGMEAFGSLRHNSTFQVASSAQVSTKRLDSVLSDLNIAQVNFVKIDAEGAELPILEGAENLLSSALRPFIIYESAIETAASYKYAPNDLHDFLRARGYIIEIIDHANYLAIPKSGTGETPASISTMKQVGVMQR